MKLDENMKLKHKILLAIGVGAFSIFLYYFLFVAVEKNSISICATFYCLELIPIGDFIAIYIAIVGLIFVVSSLNDWKVQDKYNNAKIRVAELNEISSLIDDFSFKICAFYNYKTSGENQSKVSIFVPTDVYIRDMFKAYLEDTGILNRIRELDKKNYSSKDCLFQKDFDHIIEYGYKFINGCNKEIREMAKTQEDTRESYEHTLNLIYKNHRNESEIFKKDLAELNRKLNQIVNQ
ncbi:hypothetical protein [Acinetobacter baumannii]|uniref:hypothetical protein n=2 Tax=Acinetobacter baumannii TaxID=470 RepID=UPI00148ECB29|nr:hypothetical protein [Acinetobacter baumannii]HDI2995375.1 hypothetical protein [Acinetobacter baumannii]